MIKELINWSGTSDKVTIGRHYDVIDGITFLDDSQSPRLASKGTWREAHEVLDTTPKEQADRFNAGKAELSYILSAPNAVEGLAKVFAFGATKYSRGNWKKGLPQIQVCDSLLRHLTSYMNGEEYDEESGIHHLNHVLWNALVMADQGNGIKEEKGK